MKKSRWDRTIEKLEAEYKSCTTGGERRCSHICGPYQCRRVVGHVGCHFTYMGENTARWSGKGEKMQALYPRKKS